MQLKKLVPEATQFGNLRFLSEGEPVTEYIRLKRQNVVVNRKYHLESDVVKEGIEVLVSNTQVKPFEMDSPVDLVGLTIKPVVEQMGTNQVVGYQLHAEDIVKK